MALAAIVAVFVVTVMAPAAAAVVSRPEAQPGLPTSTAVPLIGDTPSSVTSGVSELPKSVHLVARHPTEQSTFGSSSPASCCADGATVECIVPVQHSEQFYGVAVGDQTIGLSTFAGGLLGGLLGNPVGGENGQTLVTVAGMTGGVLAGNSGGKNVKQLLVLRGSASYRRSYRQHVNIQHRTCSFPSLG